MTADTSSFCCEQGDYLADDLGHLEIFGGPAAEFVISKTKLPLSIPAQSLLAQGDGNATLCGCFAKLLSKTE
jgi:hypothetical protein